MTTRAGGCFQAIVRRCNLNGSQFAILAANGDGRAEATFVTCCITGDPHEEIVAGWAEN